MHNFLYGLNCAGTKKLLLRICTNWRRISCHQ